MIRPRPLLCLVASCFAERATAQVPLQQFWTFNQSKGAYILDKVKTTGASMAYSVRKLRGGYTGPAMRVRRGTGTAQVTADVAFNTSGMVAANSVITVVTAGTTSGTTVGSTMAFSTFYAAASVYVTTWYDQSGNARNLTQTTAGNQPVIVSSGTLEVSNTIASVRFIGSSSNYMSVGTVPTMVLGSGYIGTAAAVLEASLNNTSAFGYFPTGTSMWQGRINVYGTFYFQAGNPYAQISASNPTEGLLRNYMMIASGTTPTMSIYVSGTSVGGTITGTPSSLGAASIPWYTGGAPASGTYFTGRQSEQILFPLALAAGEINIVHQSQKLFFSTP